MRRGCLSAALFVLVASAPSGVLRAEPTSTPPVVLDAKAFTLPQLSATFDKFDTELFLRKSLGIKPLDEIDLGGSKLRLDISRTPVEFVPRALNDAPELAEVIVPRHHGKKHHSRWRQYIGLTLTMPTD